MLLPTTLRFLHPRFRCTRDQCFCIENRSDGRSKVLLLPSDKTKHVDNPLIPNRRDVKDPKRKGPEVG